MIQEKAEALVSPVVEDLGYELWGCEYLAQGRHSLLRIYIDRKEGISIEDCERVSKQASAVLDVEDAIPGNYTLEVSSPGIPRPLLRWEHFARYAGQEAHIRLYKPWCGRRHVTGIIRNANPGSVVLAVDGADQEFPVSAISRAHLTDERGAE